MNDEEEEEEEVEEEEDEPRARSLAFTCEEEFTIQRRQGGMNKPHYARRDNTPRGRRLLASRREVIHAVDRGSLQPCFHPISSLRRWINLAFRSMYRVSWRMFRRVIILLFGEGKNNLVSKQEFSKNCHQLFFKQ